MHGVCAFVWMQVEHKSLTLGEVLDGDRMAMSLYKIAFKRELVVFWGPMHEPRQRP